MATKCMSCGGSMKKMKTGGTRKRYQDGGPTLEDLEKQTRREFLKGKSAKIGLGTVGAGITSIIGKKISDVVKKKREGNKEVKGLVKNLVKKAKSTRVMQKGGATLPMMGMPMYSNNPRSEQGRILKNGGSTTNRAVAPGCRGGMVKCVMERKMQDGGSQTKKNIITGRTRVTTPYAVGAPSKGTVAPRDYATGTKTEVYSKKGDLVKTKYKSRGTGKYDTGNSRYPYNYVREEEKPGGEKKEKYPILPSYMQPADKLKKAGGATTSKTLKPVPAGKPGLAKLPTPVRNKMGFQKKGGPVKKK